MTRAHSAPVLSPAPLRVLYLLRYYPTLTETFVYREIRELLARGVHVEIAARDRRADGARVPDPLPVPVRRPPRNPLRLPLAAHLVRNRPDPAARDALRDLRPHLRRRDLLEAWWLGAQARDFHRVHVHFAGEAGEWAWLARERYGVPYSVTVHAVDLFRPRPSLPRILAGADPVLAISNYNVEHIRNRYAVSAVHAPCGVPLSSHAAGSVDRQPLRIVAVGRWVPKKGFRDLVRAVESVDRHVELWLVADAPPEVGSSRVRVLGPLPPDGVQSLIREAGLVALLSRPAPDGDMDGIPVVLMEALAAGVPVLTTPVSGIPELVDEAVGWLVPPGDPPAAARTLRWIADHPEERRARGAAGPARLGARGHTLRQQVDRLLRAWGEA